MEVNFIQGALNFFIGKSTGSIIKNLEINPLPLKERLSKKPIRIAISYLHRIAIKDEIDRTWFLLVRNKRVPMFQPPGGVYKYYDKSKLTELGAKDSKYFHESNDLRIDIPRKNLNQFLKKFNENKSGWREEGFNREFTEELLDTEILPLDLFKSPQFRCTERRNSGLRFSDQFQCQEVVFYDIIDVVLTLKQKEFLSSLRKISGKGKYLFANEESIIRRGFIENKNQDVITISEHSKRIL